MGSEVRELAKNAASEPRSWESRFILRSIWDMRSVGFWVGGGVER